MLTLFLVINYGFAQINIHKTVEENQLRYDVEVVGYEFDFCDSLTIERSHNINKITIAFPAGGSMSGVRIYKADGGIGLENALLKAEGSIHQAPFVLDLSPLPNGSYTAHYTSCGVGGFLKINIR